MQKEEFNRDREAFLLSFLTIRRTIGFLGIFLPLILLLGCLIMGGCAVFQDSISHFYFTVMGDVFVGILCAVSLFLITYKGYIKPGEGWLNDNVVTNIAGVAALGIAFFATNQIKPECTLVNIKDNTTKAMSMLIHQSQEKCLSIAHLLTAQRRNIHSLSPNEFIKTRYKDHLRFYVMEMYII